MHYAETNDRCTRCYLTLELPSDDGNDWRRDAKIEIDEEEKST